MPGKSSSQFFSVMRFTEMALVFRSRSRSQGDFTFNYSNPHLISYSVLGEILTRLQISWSYDLWRFLPRLSLLTFFGGERK